MTVAVDIVTECDQIMTDIDSNETGTSSSFSTVTTPTLSYCPLSEDSCSDRNTTPGYPMTGIDFNESPDLFTKNLITTPRNRLSYQGDLRNKNIPNNRRSFQEIKLKNVPDNFQCESFNNNNNNDENIENKAKSDTSIVTESLSCSPKKDEFLYDIVLGNNYDCLSHKNSIFHHEDSSYEDVIPPCKSSIESIENLHFETEKSVENIQYETLVVTSSESCNSSQREMSVSPQVLKINLFNFLCVLKY